MLSKGIQRLPLADGYNISMIYLLPVIRTSASLPVSPIFLCFFGGLRCSVTPICARLSGDAIRAHFIAAPLGIVYSIAALARRTSTLQTFHLRTEESLSRT